MKLILYIIIDLMIVAIFLQYKLFHQLFMIILLNLFLMKKLFKMYFNYVCRKIKKNKLITTTKYIIIKMCLNLFIFNKLYLFYLNLKLVFYIIKIFYIRFFKYEE